MPFKAVEADGPCLHKQLIVKPEVGSLAKAL